MIDKKIEILVGAPCSGKTYWATEYYNTHSNKENIKYLSSDGIRIELTGDLASAWKDKEITHKTFDLMEQRFIQAIKSVDVDTIIYDATNLSRKRRIHLYDLANHLADKLGIEVAVKIELFMEGEDTLNARDTQRSSLGDTPKIGKQVIHNMFTSMQPPILEVDCDWYDIRTSDVTQWISPKIKVDQNESNAYHTETLAQHTLSAQQMAQVVTAQFNLPTDFLVKLAYWHDMGKPYTFSKDEKGTHNYNHENVSAMLYLAYAYFYENDCYPLVFNQVQLLLAIQHHMRMFQGISPKVIKRDYIKRSTLLNLQLFNIIDKDSAYKQGETSDDFTIKIQEGLKECGKLLKKNH